MFDGHPYLLTTALNKIAKGDLTLESFLKIAPTDEGLYRDFLRYYVLELEKDNLLKTAMYQVINSNIPIKIDSAPAFKLRSLGLIEYQGNQVRCLCNLYRLYFQERLKIQVTGTPINLSQQLDEELYAALISAFPDKYTLEKMVKFQLKESLEIIVGGETISELVFNLIKVAHAKSQLKELIIGAYRENSSNSKLKAVYEKFINSRN